jgi:hypothetical protein
MSATEQLSKWETSHEIDPLTRLIEHGTDKWGPHFYTPVYRELFSKLRDREIRLLEIGVGGYDIKTLGGASLAMWADYSLNGQITGIDNAEKRLDLSPRVKLFRGSQEDPAFLKQVCSERGPFDIVIDDGSHVPKHVVGSFHVLFPSLADGGLHILGLLGQDAVLCAGTGKSGRVETTRLYRQVYEAAGG